MRRRWPMTVAGVLITFVYLLPVYWMLNTSFKKPADIFATPPQLVPLSPTLRSYADAAFGNPEIGRAHV